MLTNITARERQILDIIRREPLLPQQDLADRLEITRSAVAVHIMNLTNKGFIRGKGYILTNKQYVTAIGGANIDLIGKTPLKIQPGESHPGTICTSAGGVARNISENLARLGHDIRLISVVGDDAHGLQLLDATRKTGVDVSRVRTAMGAATPTYMSIHDDAGDMSIAINDMAALNHLTPERLQEDEPLLRNTAVILIDCNITNESMDWVFNNSSEAPIFVDTVSSLKASKIRPWLNRIHTIKPNRYEAETMSGISLSDINNAPLVAQWFLDQGILNVVISLGEQGLYYASATERGWLEPTPVEVANTAGAGDALMAGLIHGYMHDMSLLDSAKFASACSAMALTSDATNHPLLSVASIERMIASKE